jgi:phosphate transport system permease protein
MIVKTTDQYRGTLAISAGHARYSLVKEKSIKTVLFFTAFFAVIVVTFILLFLLRDGLPIFVQAGPISFIFGPDWAPTSVEPLYGIFPLIAGTLLVTFGAMVFAVPLSICCAIYIAELASPRMKNILKPAIELLAGIPSVVYGFFGLIVLTGFIRVTFDLPTGETWLAASVLLGIMALPTIVSVSEDAISAVPREYKEGSLAIGATRWQTISRVLVPAALSGIAAAIILGIGRAVGETMAVMMVAGNAAIIPDPVWNILSPLRTLTGTLGIEMGEVPIGSAHYNALFGVAVVLLVITLVSTSPRSRSCAGSGRAEREELPEDHSPPRRPGKRSSALPGCSSSHCCSSFSLLPLHGGFSRCSFWREVPGTPAGRIYRRTRSSGSRFRLSPLRPLLSSPSSSSYSRTSSSTDSLPSRGNS